MQVATSVRTKAAAGHLDKEDLPVLIEGGISRLDMSKLGGPLGNKVVAIEKRLYVALKRVSDDEYSAGKELSAMQDLLKPLKLFTLWVNRQPWMPTATVYRYIQIYKLKQGDTKLSPKVIELAAAAGTPIFSNSESKPYGKLTEAVNAMPKAPNDEAGAERWLFELRVKAKELQQPRTVLSPLDRLSQSIVGAYNKQIGKEDQMDWKGFFAELTRRCELLLKRMERDSEAA